MKKRLDVEISLGGHLKGVDYNFPYAVKPCSRGKPIRIRINGKEKVIGVDLAYECGECVMRKGKGCVWAGCCNLPQRIGRPIAPLEGRMIF